jgi:Family of unknown function (DUF5954)
MGFPLMRGFDRINVSADLDPVAAMRDKDLGDRMRAYSRIIPGGPPDFGFAVQTGATWRIGVTGGGDPYSTRISLASHLRREANERRIDPGVRRVMVAAADRLDPEEGEQIVKDEWEIGDHRYRIIRMEKFILIGDRVMEPPRPTDTDPPAGAEFLEGHPIDPLAPAGPWEAQMRLNLAGWMPPFTPPVEPMVVTEARHALRTHPGVILLPPAFTAVEFDGDSIRPVTSTTGPSRAQANLVFHFTEFLPRMCEFGDDPATPQDLAAWQQAAEQIKTSPGPEFAVLGRRFCIVRVSRMMRLGSDGPEGPRPSDQERYGYPATTPQE